jgi:hypothetical protein
MQPTLNHLVLKITTHKRCMRDKSYTIEIKMTIPATYPQEKHQSHIHHIKWKKWFLIWQSKEKSKTKNQINIKTQHYPPSRNDKLPHINKRWLLSVTQNDRFSLHKQKKPQTNITHNSKPQNNIFNIKSSLKHFDHETAPYITSSLFFLSS